MDIRNFKRRYATTLDLNRDLGLELGAIMRAKAPHRCGLISEVVTSPKVCHGIRAANQEKPALDVVASS